MTRSLHKIRLCVLPMLAVCLSLTNAIGGVRNQPAIDEVAAGMRTTAEADWWGFDEQDATDSLQAAIDSVAERVVVPYVGKPWIVRPIRLRSDQVVTFEPGVLLLAKKGEFHGGGDSLLTAQNASDITIRGYGAVLRMRKTDYQGDAYEKAEWRMGLRLMGCRRVTVEGLRIENTGGDGIYVGSTRKNRWCEDVAIRDTTCWGNHRQGISVISAVNLLVENCLLAETDGTPPESGIDFEPDSADERLVNCVVRNCRFENNSGHAILVYLKPLATESQPVSIRFENCVSRMGKPGMSPRDFDNRRIHGWSGMAVGAVSDDGPQGLVEFVNCTSENTGREGAKVFDKSARSVRVRFVNCRWSNSWLSRHGEIAGPRVPVLLHLRNPEITRHPGGVEFVDCKVFENRIGALVQYVDDSEKHGLQNVTGEIGVRNRFGSRAQLGRDTRNVDLRLVEID